MATSAPRSDPERRRRRLELLAALAVAKDPARPDPHRGARMRELIARRRRFAG